MKTPSSKRGVFLKAAKIISHTLARLAERVKHLDKITFADYGQLGGNRGATSQVIKQDAYNIDVKNTSTSMTSKDTSKRRADKDKIDYLANQLANKLGDQEGIKFYYKVCWEFPFPVLERLAATAVELGRNPGAYFNALVQKELINA